MQRLTVTVVDDSERQMEGETIGSPFEELRGGVIFLKWTTYKPLQDSLSVPIDRILSFSLTTLPEVEAPEG